MKRHLLPYRFLLAILGVLSALSISLPAMAADDGRGAETYWARWRGPFDTGVAPHANPPIEWSEDQNIRWKIALPGKGHSTPIIWGDRVFVTTAIAYGEASSPGYSGVPGAHNEIPVTRRHKFVVICVNRRDGEVLWERTVREDLPHAGGHITASLAFPLPDNGRRARVRVFRVLRPLLSESGWGVGVGKGPRPDGHVARARRG